MRKSLVLAATLVLALTMGAQAENYKIDPAHSSIGFAVRHLAISKVKGVFNEFSGTIEYDPADSSKWAVAVEIKIASIDTRDDGRDDHLRGEDFFDAGKFPTMTFKSTKVKPGRNGKFQLIGDLTMRDVTKPVTLDVEMMGPADDPWGNRRLGISAVTTIDRTEFGVTWSKTLETGGLMVGHDVAIAIELEAVHAEPKGGG